ncbi:MAG: MerR family transcriptional regulator [Elusimicrobiota bacterium]
MESKKRYKDFKIDKEEPVFTIGVVSRLMKIPVWTLKKLDKEKIVSPKRREGHDRLYSKKNLNQLDFFWKLMKKKNVKIAGLKVIKEMKEKGEK